MANGARLYIRDTGHVDVAPHIEVTIDAGLLTEDENAPHPNSDLTLGELAAIHEFGTGIIPMRAPVRRWTDRFRAKFLRRVKATLRAQAKTQRWTSGPLKELTNHAARSLRSDFQAGRVKPPNALATLIKKAPEKRPLVNTKTLSNHMTASLEVRRKGFGRSGSRVYKYKAPKGGGK